MKTWLWLVVCLYCFLPKILCADTARLIGSGNLYLIMTDETTTVSPYDLGNPAGLSLLPSQFQLSENAGFISWGATGSFNEYVLFLSPIYSQFPNLGQTNNTYNQIASNNFSPNGVVNQQYQGLIDVTPDHWAFQVNGGFGYGFDNDTNAIPGYSLFGSNEFLSVAHDWGPIAFGTALLAIQNNNRLYTSETNSQVLSNSGFLVTLPLDAGPQGAHFRIGGTFQFSLQPENDQSIDNGNTTSTQTASWDYEPSVYFEIPGSLEAAVLCDFENQNTDETNNGYNTLLENLGNFNLTALCKWKISLERNNDRHPLTLNSGLDLDYSTLQYTAPYPSSQATTLFQAQVGLGLEREKDFTAGIQTLFEALNQTSVTEGIFGWINDPTNFSITGGGEKWLGPHWAVRFGLTYFHDEDPMSGEVINFIPVEEGQTLDGWMVNGGCGYRADDLKIDLAGWYEAPGTVETSNLYGPFYPQGSVIPYTAWGLQLSFAYYFSR